MISQTAEYALRAVACLSADPRVPQTTSEIADASHVPSGYLCKVLQILVKSGIVRSQRGLHGGYLLARSPQDITMLDVINAVDPIHRADGCPLGLPNHEHKPCALHKRLHEAVDTVETIFRDYTMERLMNDMDADTPLGGRTGRRS